MPWGSRFRRSATSRDVSGAVSGPDVELSGAVFAAVAFLGVMMCSFVVVRAVPTQAT